MKVLTTEGPLDLESLHIKDVVEIVNNGRKVATEYYLGEKLVKRTVTVDILMPFEVTASHGELN